MTSYVKAIVELAVQRQKVEEKYGKDSTEPRVLRGISDDELNEMEPIRLAFHEKIHAWSQEPQSQNPTQIQSMLSQLHPLTEREVLRQMAEEWMPINDSTLVLASILAPARLATILKIKEGSFGEAVPETKEAAQVHVHQAKWEVKESNDTSKAKEWMGVKNDTMDQINAALGLVTKVKSETIGPSVTELGGVRIIEGSAEKVEAKGQLNLFDQKETPVPASQKTKKHKMVIAIDGPAGSGKGTLAKLLAKTLNFDYLDTGSLYRLVARDVLNQNVDIQSEEEVMKVVNHLAASGGFQNVPTDKSIRGEVVGQAASICSTYPKVRDALRGYQKKFAKFPPGGVGAVLDGRDIGTSICPDASLKIWLDASLETRAQRRWKENPEGLSYEKIYQSLHDRDEREAKRKVDPMIKAEDAKVLDTSRLTTEEVLNQALSWVKDVKDLTAIANKSVKVNKLKM